MTRADVGAVGAVNDPVRSTVRDALHRLRAAQKPGRGAPPYSRWVNRPFGRLLAAIAASLGLVPNVVTLISASCTFSALALVALVSPHWWLGFVVSPLLLLGYALDAADGQLARLRGGGTRSGEWLDHQVDAVKVNVLHGVVLISFFRFTDASDRMLLVALGYQAVYSTMFFGIILVDQLRRSAGLSKAEAATGPSWVQALAAVPIDFGLLCLTFGLIGFQGVFRPVYACLFAANAFVLAGTMVRWWRQMQALDRDKPMALPPSA